MDSSLLTSQYNKLVANNSGPELLWYYTTGEVSNGYDLSTDQFIKTLPSDHLLIIIGFSAEAGYNATAGAFTAQGSNETQLEAMINAPGGNNPYVTTAIKPLQWKTGTTAGTPGPTYIVGWAKVSDITAASCKFPLNTNNGNRSYYQVAIFVFKPSSGKTISTVTSIEGSNFLQYKYTGDQTAYAGYSEADTTVTIPSVPIPSGYSALRLIGCIGCDMSGGGGIPGLTTTDQINSVATTSAEFNNIVPLNASSYTEYRPLNSTTQISLSTSTGSGYMMYTYNDKNARNIKSFSAKIGAWRRASTVDAWMYFGMLILIKEV